MKISKIKAICSLILGTTVMFFCALLKIRISDHTFLIALGFAGGVLGVVLGIIVLFNLEQESIGFGKIKVTHVLRFAIALYFILVGIYILFRPDVGLIRKFIGLATVVFFGHGLLQDIKKIRELR